MGQILARFLSIILRIARQGLPLYLRSRNWSGTLGKGVRVRGYRWWSGVEGEGWGSQIECREEIRVVSADLKAAEEVVV